MQPAVMVADGNQGCVLHVGAVYAKIAPRESRHPFLRKQMMAEEAKKVTIDGNEYEWEALTEEARTAFLNITATDNELRRLRTQFGIAQAARQGFSRALRDALPETTADS
ncbi:hypothetical protein KHP57_15620 [Algiphilus sp. NNCM1]|uniref:DUF6447 family protein n=1 Tax=Algiphilus sp. TaxID=1872431 RepID=UPI001CA60277|nr:DUF6447 family protein [Algiphilus sp.]MBY8967135.1 hypothetical protein [Algiphilus acroporae]MCI5062052.1 DUF6447 family protein [Algiphilus sp.]MCI5102591.1 DUF6447 family protein [Algiphilus sp.]